MTIDDPKNILYIKLGARGGYEYECIEQNSSIKIGYGEIDHNLCLAKEWQKVSSQIAQKYKSGKIATTSHKNQIKRFYEEPETTMWITFYKGKLWYCFVK